jgi:hypothetical protein
LAEVIILFEALDDPDLYSRTLLIRPEAATIKSRVCTEDFKIMSWSQPGKLPTQRLNSFDDFLSSLCGISMATETSQTHQIDVVIRRISI